MNRQSRHIFEMALQELREIFQTQSAAEFDDAAAELLDMLAEKQIKLQAA